MTSSSGNISGYSENADCLPIVEHMQEDNKTAQSVQLDSTKTGLRGFNAVNFNDVGNDSFSRIVNQR